MLSSHSSSLLAIILQSIDQSPQKQITFAQYMNLALYHREYGYYSSGKVHIGAEGDFFTSSSLGSDFGELLAEKMKQLWDSLGNIQPFYCVEMGAGNGNLAYDFLNHIQQQYPDFFLSLQYIIIEESPTLQKLQQVKLQPFLEKTEWKKWTEIADNSLQGCFFSNELVDAFPVDRILYTQGKLQEIYITAENQTLREVIGDLSTDKIKEYFTLSGINFSPDSYEENYQTEVNLGIFSWLDEINRTLKRGYLLTIDYGYLAEKYYHPQRYQGTLKCYYQHRHHDNPYINIGEQDITAHVNFTLLQKYGEKIGLSLVNYTSQALFLMELGLGDRLQALSTGKYNFQEILSRRNALHQWINPMGLGGFQVLLQSKL